MNIITNQISFVKGYLTPSPFFSQRQEPVEEDGREQADAEADGRAGHVIPEAQEQQREGTGVKREFGQQHPYCRQRLAFKDGTKQHRVQKKLKNRHGSGSNGSDDHNKPTRHPLWIDL